MLFRKKIIQEFHQLLKYSPKSENSVLTDEEVKHLPAPVIKWLQVSGAIGRQKAENVWLKQSFQLKLNPDQKKWYHSNAMQLINTTQTSFVWTIQLSMPPFLTILGRDKLVEGKGEMRMKLFGLFNILTETGDKIDEGTLQRYLGEIVWNPFAAISPNIIWKEINHQSAEATLSHNNISVSGIFIFNEKGHFHKFETYRYKENKPDSKRFKWDIVARDYDEMDGVVIPTLLDVTWHLKEKAWTWSILKVEQLSYDISELPARIDQFSLI